MSLTWFIYIDGFHEAVGADSGLKAGPEYWIRFCPGTFSDSLRSSTISGVTLSSVIQVVDGYYGSYGTVDIYMYPSGAPCKLYHLDSKILSHISAYACPLVFQQFAVVGGEEKRSA